jgi:two-component system response regulator LytT
LYDNTLEVLELRLNPKKFFRINRQFIVGFDCIRQVNSYDNRGRLKLETDPVNKEEMIVSIHRSAEFRTWMGG